jgi:hypothetical protein
MENTDMVTKITPGLKNILLISFFQRDLLQRTLLDEFSSLELAYMASKRFVYLKDPKTQSFFSALGFKQCLRFLDNSTAADVLNQDATLFTVIDSFSSHQLARVHAKRNYIDMYYIVNILGCCITPTTVNSAEEVTASRAESFIRYLTIR